MDRLTIVAGPSRHQQEHADALAAGCAALGVATTRALSSLQALDTRAVACWGWHTGRRLQAHGHSVLVMERGYLGDRFAWSSLAWGGLNGRGRAPVIDDDGERFRAHHGALWRSWRGGSGRYVLIVGQVPGDASLGGRDLYGDLWYAQQARAAARYGVPVYFRPHPLGAARGAPQQILGADTLNGSLAEALAGAALVVTYNSNTGVESLLAGIPTVVADPGGMGWPIALHALPATLDVSEPEGRAAWAYALAWRQWTLAEIAGGEALRRLLSMPQIDIGDRHDRDTLSALNAPAHAAG